MWKKFHALTAGVGVSAAGYMSYDEGAKRSGIFWSNVFPIYLQYRFMQLMNRDLSLVDDQTADEYYTRCHDKFSEPIRDLTFRLRGFYLKQAQLLSMQDTFVPPQYMKWMKLTQDAVPSEFTNSAAKEYFIKILKDELNLNFDEVFEQWDDQPIGVASIGQVHKAVLRQDFCKNELNMHNVTSVQQRTVAIKFIAPNMEQKFRSDIATLKAFCQLAMPQHVSSFNEVEKQFLTEFNYTREGQNLQLIHDNMMPRFSNLVTIPRPLLTSKSILIMEFLNGTRIIDGITSYYQKYMADQDLEKLKIEIQKNKRSLNEMKQDDNTMKQYLLVKDILLSYNIPRFIYNYSILRLLTGPVEYQFTTPPPSLSSILEILCKVQASQIFEDGAFNGDNHPGNIMLLNDGKLGLIDMGQVKRISLEERIIFAKVIIAHARRDKEEVVRLHFDEVGTVTKYKNKEIAYLMSAFYNDRNTYDICGDRNIASFIDYCESIDPMVQLPENYIMLARSSLMLRGFGNAFGLELSVAELWYDDAVKFLKSQNIHY